MIVERVAIIGVGKIGVCLALNLERAGFDVLGVDTRSDHVARVNDRTFSTPEPGVDEALRAARNLRAVGTISAVRDFSPSLIVVAVDTHVMDGEGYDTRRIDAVLRNLCALGSVDPVVDVVVMSTAIPGFCDSRAVDVERFGYSLCYSPGFVAQGTIMRDQRQPDQVLIGVADDSAGERLARLYRRMCTNTPSVHRMSRLGAEIAKLATNCFLTMKIAFANAIGDLAVRAGAEPELILDAVGADGRIGRDFLRYGFSYGGPCLPRDNRALNAFAEELGCDLLQAEATDQMNRRHMAFQLQEYLRLHSAGEPINFHSVCYKPGVEMLEQSQPLALAVQLARAGRSVVIHEAPAVIAELRERFGELFEYRIEGALPD